ncbi:hypothetical protein EK0264_04475 [Epidermidibacterium keratini]|uniref:Uncharacterized protein n=1 Tax=Epidermidibacterium keratini TaxID=1891644 RepID=A0A7L4YLA0_9ACTN|nr:hypothetical protein [Epidermidibacterium keratini]QHB99613.1 hypothetical protein EK0264_04475 [Epidermidibacterium keratini]
MSVEVLEREAAKRELRELGSKLAERVGTCNLAELRDMSNRGELDDATMRDVERMRTLSFLLGE